MTVKQISIFLENRPGQLADITKALGENNIDMRSLCIAEAAEFGIVRLIVDAPDKAAKILTDAGYICSITQVIAVVVDDEPGGLNKVLEILRAEDINLEYAYVFTAKKKGGAYNIFHVTEKDTEKAVALLHKNGVELVTQEELDTL